MHSRSVLAPGFRTHQAPSLAVLTGRLRPSGSAPWSKEPVCRVLWGGVVAPVRSGPARLQARLARAAQGHARRKSRDGQAAVRRIECAAGLCEGRGRTPLTPDACLPDDLSSCNVLTKRCDSVASSWCRCVCASRPCASFVFPLPSARRVCRWSQSAILEPSWASWRNGLHRAALSPRWPRVRVAFCVSKGDRQPRRMVSHCPTAAPQTPRSPSQPPSALSPAPAPGHHLAVRAAL